MGRISALDAVEHPVKFALLSAPVPALAAAWLPQVAPDALAGGPGWLATALLGVWVTLWFLDRVGRLPGGGAASADHFGPDERQMLNELHMLFAARDDDGIERWPRFMRNQRDTNKELIAALRDTNTKLERLVLAMERDQRMRES